MCYYHHYYYLYRSSTPAGPPHSDSAVLGGILMSVMSLEGTTPNLPTNIVPTNIA